MKFAFYLLTGIFRTLLIQRRNLTGKVI